MPDPDICLEKTRNIQNCLRRIHDMTQGNPDTLDDQTIEDVVVLNLQRAVQSVIDLAAHIVGNEGLGLPDTLRENFDLLSKAKIIPDELGTEMKHMVGFRNIAVHDYQTLNKDVLKSILRTHLSDLEAFYSQILIHYGIVPQAGG